MRDARLQAGEACEYTTLGNRSYRLPDHSGTLPQRKNVKEHSVVRGPGRSIQMHEILRQDPEIWRLFACEEEYRASFRDRYDRFPHYVSGNRQVFEPRASDYLFERGYRPEYPDGQPFAVCLTHDVDIIYQSYRKKGLDLLLALAHGNRPGLTQVARNMRDPKHPLCNFDEILALEEEYDATSTFFFLALQDGDQDHSYEVEDLAGEIGMIADHGWEVGLHGGHQAYADIQKLKDEKERMERVLSRPVTGYRNHYLRFRVPETWELLNQAGFHYDTTLGYADCVGFRNGMCYPFRPYHCEKNQEIRIVEIPLTVMDRTLEVYMRLGCRQSWDLITQLIDTVERCRGVITLLWHNTSLDEDGMKFYEKILRYCKEKGAWMTGGEEIITWEGYNRLE